MSVSDNEDTASVGSSFERVRSLLKLSNRGCGGFRQSAKEKLMRETERWKDMFRKCDTNGGGTLNIGDVTALVRKKLKVAERLVSDNELKEIFASIDTDGDGTIIFTEFLKFLNGHEKSSGAFNDRIVAKVKRTVRLAFRKLGMSLDLLEYRFLHSAEEGIMDSTRMDGALGPEEMRRFFRKVLAVSEHDATDRDLHIAFKVMDEDDSGSLDGSEFMAFIRSAFEEEESLSPKHASTQQGPCLLGGMRGCLPSRTPHTRPGTNYTSGVAAVPFCLNGRDVLPQVRLAMDLPAALRKTWRSQPSLGLTLQAVREGEATSLRTTWANGFTPSPAGGQPMASQRSHSPRSSAAGEVSDASASSLSRQPHARNVAASGSSSCPGLPNLQQGPPRGGPVRGNYLNIKHAEVLNRVEQGLFRSGIDVRGHYHRRL
mmetsp:Transcript_70058/g.155008  ORF Transcript_70058/g.155008 Transcript_70058/m.155008 type:complete len:429 (+) Transcript_70058:49-1335(+)